MISVVIPTLNAAATLAETFEPLIPAAVAGLVREVIVADGGSSDDTAAIADAAGAHVLAAPRGRGAQLAAGAEAARGPWLLFLHADTALGPGWTEEVERFLRHAEDGAGAAAFRFALDDPRGAARRIEAFVRLRCAVFALPYGDQGLLISKRLYRELGGYRPLPLMEDVDLVRRIGRRRLTLLQSRAVTSAARYRKGGFVARPLRNLGLLSLYYLGVPPRTLARLYG